MWGMRLAAALLARSGRSQGGRLRRPGRGHPKKWVRSDNTPALRAGASVGDHEERKRGAVDVGPHAAAGGLDITVTREGSAATTHLHCAQAQVWTAARSVSEEQWT
jgi:hypothetical protein